MNQFSIMLAIISLALFSLAPAASAAPAGASGKTLPPKQAAIVPIAALMANGDLDRLETALNEGLDAGLTVNEIKEVLVQMYAYCGFPRSLNAINTFMAVTEDRKARGVRDVMGKEASPLPTGKTKERYGHEVRAGLVGGEFPPAGYALFVPVIDIFLKEHLFADIFLRDNLDHRSREIATVSALSSLNVPAQLRSHLNICLNIGLSRDQLEELSSILASKVGKLEGDLAARELKTVVASRAK